MKLDEVTKIKQTSDENVVNDFLSRGYRIIKIFSTKTTVDGQEFVNPVHILGLK